MPKLSGFKTLDPSMLIQRNVLQYSRNDKKGGAQCNKQNKVLKRENFPSISIRRMHLINERGFNLLKLEEGGRGSLKMG